MFHINVASTSFIDPPFEQFFQFSEEFQVIVGSVFDGEDFSAFVAGGIEQIINGVWAFGVIIIEGDEIIPGDGEGSHTAGDIRYVNSGFEGVADISDSCFGHFVEFIGEFIPVVIEAEFDSVGGWGFHGICGFGRGLEMGKGPVVVSHWPCRGCRDLVDPERTTIFAFTPAHWGSVLVNNVSVAIGVHIAVGAFTGLECFFVDSFLFELICEGVGLLFWGFSGSSLCELEVGGFAPC